MDVGSIAGTALLMRAEQTREALSASMLKQAAAQQNAMADILAQNSELAPQPVTTGNTGFNFSTYA